MTISINYIEGNRRSACNNDAYAVVENGTEVIAIVPAAQLQAKGLSTADLQKAFEKAATTITCKNAQKRHARQEAHARHLLGL